MLQNEVRGCVASPIINRNDKIVVYLFMRDVPILSIDNRCFERLRRKYSHNEWIFCRNDEEFEQNLYDATIVICWKFTSEYYLKAPKLKAIFTPAAGRDWIYVSPDSMISVYHSHFHGELMSESLLGMITYFNNSLYYSLSCQRRSIWDRKTVPKRVLLKGQHIVIVGYGSIGRKCASMLKKNGCTVTGVKRKMPKIISDQENINITVFDKLQEVLPVADHVVLILPGDHSTDNIFTRDHIRCMKSTAVLHNLGRGNCIRESDLLWALKNNVIKGAALDVFENEPLSDLSPLWNLDNVLITPHSTCFYDEYGYLFTSELEKYFNF